MRRILTAALLFVILCAASSVGVLVSASPASATTPTMTATEKTWSNAILGMINSERKANHVAAVTMNADLQCSAFGHDLDMSKYDSMSHQLPGEPVFTTRMVNCGYTGWRYAGENIAYSAPTEKVLESLQTYMYDEKPPDNGHRLNILNPKYVNVGVSVYIDTKHNCAWLTEDFGQR